MDVAQPDPFRRHGITHLSPSSINAYARSSAMWVMEKLLGRHAPSGISAARGTAAELGVVTGLIDGSATLLQCQKVALTEFARLTPGFHLQPTDKWLKERDALPGLVRQGLLALRGYGTPQPQVRVEKMLPGVPVPFVGYIDLFYPQHTPPIVIDLKTSLRLASEIAPDHARQVALYIHDTNHEGRLCYVTPTKHAVYRLEDAPARIGEVVRIADAIETFLSLGDTETLRRSVVPDLSHAFLFTNPETRAMARESFGL